MKAGIIGCGTISSVYLENLQNSPLIEVVAVADLLDERADEFKIENVYKADELLRQPEIELVFNLTVPGSHARSDVAILEAGKHVYSEKPLAH
ncbi:Gfo/Idh/MocA family protein [Paenibacillus sp. Lou8.1]|uniref:Gfo/Idh/MocA family protein n=1 Tax=Paenibacillus sp. Lou8.1 TaxID=2962041 RepID=UPI0020B73265|nr:Gfo/Idh/MocA family oxidoreductase [Paenibacillus sp. Lou8.1]